MLCIDWEWLPGYVYICRSPVLLPGLNCSIFDKIFACRHFEVYTLPLATNVDVHRTYLLVVIGMDDEYDSNGPQKEMYIFGP